MLQVFENVYLTTLWNMKLKSVNYNLSVIVNLHHLIMMTIWHWVTTGCHWQFYISILKFIQHILFGLIIKYVSEDLADGTEEKLYRTLLDPTRYQMDIRPTTHHSLPTNVTFGFLLNQIVEMVRFLPPIDLCS